MSDVGCAGILVEDTFCGPIPALPPEGALHLLEDLPVKAGGCAANVAIDLAKQGVATDVVGCVGADSSADVLVDALERRGVRCSQVQRVEGQRTSKTVILLIERQDRRYFHVVGANRAFSLSHISRDWLSQLKVFYLGGLFALPGIEIGELEALLRFCREVKVTTVVDVVVPHGTCGMSKLKPLLPHIDVFVPNDDEARAFTGVTDTRDQLKVFAEAGASTTIITRGAQGSVAAQAGNIWSCGTYDMNVVDPSGSGDAFTSGVIRALLEGWDIPQMLRYASAIGASATRAPGTTDSVFSAVEADAFLKGRSLTVSQRR
jgi:sugar/nucleoside kinase (ribokinase family)